MYGYMRTICIACMHSMEKTVHGWIHAYYYALCVCTEWQEKICRQAPHEISRRGKGGKGPAQMYTHHSYQLADCITIEGHEKAFSGFWYQLSYCRFHTH
jgi:hypothetical protein